MKISKWGVIFSILYVLYVAYYLWISICNSEAECSLLFVLPSPFFPSSLILSFLPFSENFLGLLPLLSVIAVITNFVFYFVIGMYIEKLFGKRNLQS